MLPTPIEGGRGSDVSGRADVRCLQAFLPFLDLELDLLAFLEGAVATHLDCRVVDEHVRPIGLRDEAETLFSIEPFDSSGRHVGDPPSFDNSNNERESL